MDRENMTCAERDEVIPLLNFRGDESCDGVV